MSSAESLSSAPPLPLAESIVTRRLSSRRPIAFATWMAVGALGTYVDKIHEWLGVVAYPNPDWIGEQLFVSPVYVTATLGFFILYTAIVGHRGSTQGVFGGRKLSGLDVVYAFGCWIAVYCISGFLGAKDGHPFLAALILFASAAPPLWKARRTQLPAFALLVAVLGTGFEWTATTFQMFEYPVCPSPACVGSTVPLLWLFPLYLHAALLLHRLLGGKHALTQRPRALAQVVLLRKGVALFQTPQRSQEARHEKEET